MSKKYENGRAIPCALHSDCQRRTMCGDSSCPIICRMCRKPGLRCTDICPDYVPKTCAKPEKPPYVCNACKKPTGCLMERVHYYTKYADDAYRDFLVSSRDGINQNPIRLEFVEYREMRTKIYFCNPHSFWQKGMIEKNHEYICLVIPKGRSLDCYTREDVVLLMNHISSEARDNLHGRNPYKLSLMLLNNKLHEVLHLKEIPPDEVTLCPNLLKK